MELYKRYRPKRLSNIVGNETTVGALTRMLKAGDLPHNILLHGPSGCGKTTLARIVRREIGCSDLDFAEQNCASDFRGVDSVRETQRNMKLAPTGGKVRVFLWDEVHQLTKEAQHASLKMLEDTPRHVYFILCTTDPGKLLPTIRTRATAFPVTLLSTKELLTLLQRVTKQAGLSIEPDILEDVADAADGSARTALVLLDKLAHLDSKLHVTAVKEKLDGEQDAIVLCRALIKNESWNTVSKLLREITADPEGVRHLVLAYATTILLRQKNDRAYMILEAFATPFYDTKRAGLVKACYEATFAS